MIDFTNEIFLVAKASFDGVKKIESGIKHEGNYFRFKYSGWKTCY